MLSDTIKTARGIVEKGWCKGRYADGKGNFCVYGATMQAEGTGWQQITWGDWSTAQPVVYSPAAAKASRFLDEIARQMGYRDSAKFNDDLHTTHQDVLNFFDKALAELGAL
jgi:hypothetical protein